MDATAGARAIADNGSSVLTLGIKAADEGTMAGGWKQYGNDATLSIVYEVFSPGSVA
ncbi:hypothetical protein NKG05_01010 [Oerskovia sp. M15]